MRSRVIIIIIIINIHIIFNIYCSVSHFDNCKVIDLLKVFKDASRLIGSGFS